jgi:hypothetical protein
MKGKSAYVTEVPVGNPNSKRAMALLDLPLRVMYHADDYDGTAILVAVAQDIQGKKKRPCIYIPAGEQMVLNTQSPHTTAHLDDSIVWLSDARIWGGGCGGNLCKGL